MIQKTAFQTVEAAAAATFTNGVIGVVETHLNEWERRLLYNSKNNGLVTASLLGRVTDSSTVLSPGSDCTVPFYLLKSTHRVRVISDLLDKNGQVSRLSEDVTVIEPDKVYILIPQLRGRVAVSLGDSPVPVTVTAVNAGVTTSRQSDMVSFSTVQVCASSASPLRPYYQADEFCGKDECPVYSCEQPGYDPLTGEMTGQVLDPANPEDCCLCEFQAGRFFAIEPIGSVPAGEVPKLTIVPFQLCLDLPTASAAVATNGYTGI